MRIRSVRRRGLVAAAVVGAGALLVGVLARGAGLPVSRVGMSGGTVWLASPATGVVTLVDGVADEIVGLRTVPGAVAGDELSVVQAGTSAYLADATRGTVSRVDGGTYEATGARDFGASPGGLRVLAGPSAAYVVDGARRLASVADPVTLAVREQLPLSVAPQDDQSVVDDAGRLWMVDGDGLTWFDRDGRHRRAGVAGAGTRLVVVRGRAALVDPARQRVTELADDGSPGQTSCVDLNAADRPRLLGSASDDRVIAALPGTGVLVTSGGAGRCGEAIPGVSAPGDRLGPLAESGGFVFVPDWTTGRTAVVDLAGRRLAGTVDLTGPNRRVDLLARDGLVFFNDLDGDAAGVIRFDGHTWRAGAALHKYTQGDGKAGALAGAGGALSPDAPGPGPQPGPDAAPAGTPGPVPPGTAGGPLPPGTGGAPPPGGLAGPLPPGTGGAPPPGGLAGPLPPGTGGVPPVAGGPAGGAGGPGVGGPGGGGTAPAGARTPVIRAVTANPSPITRGKAVTFSADVTDAAGATWTWVITDQGTGAVTRATTPGSATVTPATGGTAPIQVGVTVTTAAGATPSTRSFPTTSGVVPKVTVTPGQQTVTDGRVATFTATVSTGDPAATWTWTVLDNTGKTAAGPTAQPAGQVFAVQINAGLAFGQKVVFTAKLTVRTADGGSGSGQVTFTVAQGFGSGAFGSSHVTLTGTGTGTITQDGGSPCRTGCQIDGQLGHPVTVTATPDAGSTFAGWTGPCQGQGPVCRFDFSLTDMSVTFSRG